MKRVPNYFYTFRGYLDKNVDYVGVQLLHLITKHAGQIRIHEQTSRLFSGELVHYIYIPTNVLIEEATTIATKKHIKFNELIHLDVLNQYGKINYYY